MADVLEYHDRVRDDWIDYNGHLSEPFYVMVFGFATTSLMDHVGLDEAYRTETGCSLYTVEAHVRYLREVGPGADLHVTTFVTSVAAKKAVLCHELRVGGELVATEELTAIHVAEEGAAPFPDHVADKLRRLLQPAPEYAGRAIRC
ncbi:MULTISPECIES: thioesterase family protein [Prauserella salsuginis group]|uniref:Thioesterase family protein n=1 Tax=Prauserella salsuginis TaxID=387889 RepID=A0ABW6GAE7_9PSEU|nr:MULTISPECIES: thioesterase family protein [Prauserella salsuginis group]MCR3722965.1 acyl-CoA thioester hydrolase [Prauserella flava]MCR3737359.1 acyl-CoA thioester hydrolase [Prauserella salsuginis]